MACKIAAAFHDIGKADTRFQQYLIGKKIKIFHPLLGLPVIDEIAKFLPKLIHSLVVLAVASHHTPLHKDLYALADDTQKLEVENKCEFENVIDSLLRRIGIGEENALISDNYYNRKCKAVLNQCKFNFSPSASDDKIKLREDFIIIQGILNYSDWLASGQEEFQKPEMKDFIPDPYHYQKKARTVNDNLFITLPTGSGKTETALYWISGNFHSTSRVFYTLPTTTTINSMYQRLIDKNRNYGFDESNVAEYFSNVDLYLDLEGNNPTKANLNLYKNFFYPFNITTPDQLILSLMNHQKYTLKSFMMKNSLIIFDEIHAYDAETFGLIKALILHFQKYHSCKFCIMSATFPEALKKELYFLNAQELVNQKVLMEEYKKRRRTQFEFHEEYLSNAIDSIFDLFVQNKKILVVLNTVSKAQDIYIKLKQLLLANKFSPDNLMLIHSRFTFLDRRTLEKRIYTFPKIVVATQIIEVSLDIDYDVLFTEVCYPDSLVQRAGRINRFGKLGNNGEGIIKIFLPEGWQEDAKRASLPYDERLLNKSIDIMKERSNTITSEYDYIEITNSFYNQNWVSSDEAEKRFHTIWHKLNFIYRAKLSEEDMIELLRTRSGILTVQSYSDTHYDFIMELDKQLRLASGTNEKANIFRRIRGYGINVPMMRYTKFYKKPGESGAEYLFVKSTYDNELGLQIIHDNVF
jgi:CRISPR-associated endonuclease/helicase Cas3